MKKICATFEKELEGFPGIVERFVEYYDDNGDVETKAIENIIVKAGVEHISGYTNDFQKLKTDCGIWSPSLIKDDKGQWNIYYSRKMYPFTKENIETIGVSHRMVHLAEGKVPEMEKTLRSIPRLLSDKDAFAITSDGVGTVIVCGRKVKRIGCEQGLSRLMGAGIINGEGEFLAVTLTDRRLKTLGITLKDKILTELLEFVSK